MKKLSVFLAALMLLAFISGCGQKEEASQMGATMELDLPDFSLAPVETFDTSNIGASIELDLPDFTIAPVETFDTSNIGTTIDFELPEFSFDPIATYEPIDLSKIGATIEFSPSILEFDLKTAEAQEVANDISIGLPEEDSLKLQELEPVEIEQIVTIQLNLLADLQLAFEQVGMPVRVNETTGEITMDSTVLFGVNQSTVSEEGKQLLQQFMHVYSHVVFNEKYESYVSKIFIEGHTDSTNTYEHNLKLSQERADQVLAYLLSDECGLSETHREQLKESAQTIGYSFDRPVLDAQGNENMTASRRVCFRFLIALD